MGGSGKRRLGITVAERAVAEDDAAAPCMQYRRGGIDRRNRIDHQRQRPIRNLDAFERIRRGIAVARQNHCNRLADIVHAINRKAPCSTGALTTVVNGRVQRLASSPVTIAATPGRADAALVPMDSS
jgi:hypothetical protein